MNREDARRVLLEVIAQQADTGQDFGADPILEESAKRLGIRSRAADERVLLSVWHELYRNGVIAWGINLSNPSYPWFHVTDQGNAALVALSKDPANPAGY